MAIPGWLWTGSDGEGAQSTSFSDTSEIREATDVFDVLSHATRLTILIHLHDQTRPVLYNELREATSVRDKGRFNYHLRQLEGLVRSSEGKYTLTRRGEKLVRSVLSDQEPLVRQ
ncbi:ArsR/SmtB family transcription factor [Haloarcula pelagica]|uniref:ArsR/SmtB family transcription factor n=1 Tax=Haloarcula pelagica TaxID=3033389 RepID=UPI003AF32445